MLKLDKIFTPFSYIFFCFLIEWLVQKLWPSLHRNSYRPSFSRPVSSLQFPLSNECNVLAGEQIFLVVRSSSILTSQGFFVSWDSLFSNHPRRQRTPCCAGRMMTLPLEISAPLPAHCIHWRAGTEGWIPTYWKKAGINSDGFASCPALPYTSNTG